MKKITTITDWPPPYRIKESTRAKYIRLEIHPKEGVHIIVPKGQSHEKAIQFMLSKKAWLLNHLPAPSSLTEVNNKLPHLIDLRATNNQWVVEYLPAKRTKLYVNHYDKKLLIKGERNQPQLIYPHLLGWLYTEAERVLTDKLASVSQKIALPYNAIQFRRQKRIWGSCSRDHKISLNIKLIFMPMTWVEYVLTHELCHTRHFNHSPAFWQLVEGFCAEYQTIRNAMKTADQLIPHWV